MAICNQECVLGKNKYTNANTHTHMLMLYTKQAALKCAEMFAKCLSTRFAFVIVCEFSFKCMYVCVRLSAFVCVRVVNCLAFTFVASFGVMFFAYFAVLFFNLLFQRLHMCIYRYVCVCACICLCKCLTIVIRLHTRVRKYLWAPSLAHQSFKCMRTHTNWHI